MENARGKGLNARLLERNKFMAAAKAASPGGKLGKDGLKAASRSFKEQYTYSDVHMELYNDWRATPKRTGGTYSSL